MGGLGLLPPTPLRLCQAGLGDPPSLLWGVRGQPQVGGTCWAPGWDGELVAAPHARSPSRTAFSGLTFLS